MLTPEYATRSPSLSTTHRPPYLLPMPILHPRLLAALFLSGLGASGALAQVRPVFRPAPNAEAAGFSPARLSRIDSLVLGAVERGEINGAVVHIVRRGRVVLHRAYGVRDTETKVPMRRDDIFRIASQSKAITALAVMMLWEEGHFTLDEPISRLLPEFARPRVLTAFNGADSTAESEPANREITVRQLLTHTSGLDYAGIGSADFRALYAKHGVPSGIGNDRSTIGEQMRILGRLPLRARPGERYTYSLSFDVLGYLVEVVSGMPFDQFLRTRIFEPLGMRDTWFYLPPDRHERLVTLHDGESGRAVPLRGTAFDGANPNYPRLAGTYFSGGAGLSSTTEDYARFLQLFLNKGELGGVRLLGPRTVEMMLTDQLPTMTNKVGLGFGLETEANDFRSPRSIGAFSWGGAFATTYWADPRDELIAQIYTNMVNPAARDLAGRFNTLTYAAIVR